MRAEDKWADKLRHKMDDYAEPLPNDMWKKIEHDMPVPRVIPLWRRAWSYAAVAAVLLASSVSLWFWNSTPASHLAEQVQTNEEVMQTITRQIETSKESLVSSVEEEKQLAALLPVGDKSATASYNTVAKAVGRSSAPSVSVLSEAAVLSVDDSVATDDAETTDTPVQTVQSEPENKENYMASSRSLILADRKVMAKNASQVRDKKRESRKGGWSFGLSAGNIPYTSSHTNTGMRSLSPNVAYKYAEDANAIFRKAEEITSISFSKFETEVKHKMPIVVSAGFRYNFTSRWGIESGLSYTLLSSDWFSAGKVNVYQKLHYIGIPLRVNYNILNSRFFTLYASAGGMMEKCVHAEMGKRNGTYTGPESLSCKPFQWSVSAAMGAQFNIIRQLGLFVEPGVSYFFDDGSEYQTIRKEYPFNFNLNLGLRVTFGR